LAVLRGTYVRRHLHQRRDTTEIGALAEIGLVFVPRIQASGVALGPAGIEPLSLTLRSTRTYPDGVIETWYLPA
jgi:hypothetical protein